MSQCGKLTTNTGLKTLYFHVMSYISSEIAGNILACILYVYLHVHVYPYTIINMIIHFCFFSKIQTTHKSMHAHVHLVNSMCMPSDSWDVLDTPLKIFCNNRASAKHTHSYIYFIAYPHWLYCILISLELPQHHMSIFFSLCHALPLLSEIMI